MASALIDPYNINVEIKPYDELPPLENIDSSNLETIDHISSNLSYEEFFNKYMRPNIPCVLKNITNSRYWECTKKWVRNDKIDHDYMTNEYGNLFAPVADCNNSEYNAHIKNDMRVRDYMKYLKSEQRNKLLYLKDWHLVRTRPRPLFYKVPAIFASDWLNEYVTDKQADDYMFVYIGPKDSWTGLHADVYSSFSWSVNVFGQKKWILFPPEEEEKLKDKLRNLPQTFEPNKFKNIKYYEIIQEKGDAIFVPSNWFHQVINLTDTISINHNWVNGCNIGRAWESLTKALTSVEHEIAELNDIEEFPVLCQNMLKSLHGMDCERFLKWITHIGEKRLRQLDGNALNTFNSYPLGRNHMKFDLTMIKQVMLKIETHPAYVNDDFRVYDNFLTLKDFLTDFY